MIRIPRPLGATEAGKNLYEDQSKKNKWKLRRILIKAFIAHNLYVPASKDTYVKASNKNTANQKQKKSSKNKDKLQGEYIGLNTIELCTFGSLALGLGLSESKLEDKVQKVLVKDASQMATQQGMMEIEAIARVIFRDRFFKSLGRVPEMFDWADELKTMARLRGYQPGLVMGTNTAYLQALNQEEKAMNMLLKLGTQMQPLRPINNTQNNLYLGTQNPQNKGLEGSTNPDILTPTMAVRILEEKGITREPINVDLLAQQYGIFGPEVPDVKALPTDAQGANNFKIEDIVKINKHEDHREREEAIEEVVIID